MRLDPSEVPNLPLPAALMDRDGRLITATPEWVGAPPGSLSYHAGEARIVVAPGTGDGGGERLARHLFTELRSACRAMEAEQALRAAVLVGGLELVAAAEAPISGTTLDVVEHARAAIAARVPGVTLESVPGARPQPAPAPAQLALALAQLAVNAAVHEGATRLRLRIGLGPSFHLEWPATGGVPVAGGHGHPRLRSRWGLGYVRMAADALGAVALPPGPTEPGWRGACLSLGSRRLALPLAVFAGSTRIRATQTWEQDLRSREVGVEGSLAAGLSAVLREAARRPGAIVRVELFAARWVAGQTWVALVPETGPGRVRDVLRGLDHERALWSAPEPHATRVHALIALLAGSLGEPPTVFAPEAFAREFPLACAALGIPPPPVPPLLASPDPRLAAFLVAELGGRLIAQPDGVFVVPSPAPHPLAALVTDDRGRVRLTPQ